MAQIGQHKRAPLKKNPLKNLGALLKLNPYAKTARRMQLAAEVTLPPSFSLSDLRVGEAGSDTNVMY